MRKIFCFFILLFFFFSNTSVRAENPFPLYDSNSFCFRHANTPDGVSDQALSACLSQQSIALYRVKHQWDSVPSYVQSECDRLNRKYGDPDYAALNSCLTAQMALNPPQIFKKKPKEPKSGFFLDPLATH
ncbi:hypothetical protein ACF3NX_07105 [Acetobacter orientalis]|uniref:hypothetical protein n=1 Tax=Acetobacter orientalis TaxID=146474 RepID=UPI00386E01A5